MTSNTPDPTLADDLQKSLDRLLQKLPLTPHDPTIHNAVGVILGARGDVVNALAAFDHAIKLLPTYAEAFANRGHALADMGRLDEALAAFTSAAELTPHYGEAEDRVDDLAAALNRARPTSVWRPTWHRRLRAIFAASATPLDEAAPEVELRARLNRYPNDANCAFALGRRLKSEKRQLEAEHFFRYALQLDPKHSRAALALADSLEAAGRLVDAVAVLSAFATSQPREERLLPLLLRLRTELCDWTGYQNVYDRATDVVRRTPGAIEPFATLALWDDPGLQAESAKAFAARRYPVRSPMVVTKPASGDGKLRLGYLSGDFHQNAVASLKAELFELHDRRRFAVHAYAVGPYDGSSIYRRIATACDRFTPFSQTPAEKIAAQIAADGIDILIDLSGYTRHGRPDVLSFRAAPVQVNDGNAATMGAPFMDYIIADRVVVPDGQAPFFSEKLIRLAQPFQINDRKRPRPKASRGDFGFDDTNIILCSFSTPSKISPALFAAWMRILAQVPATMLWLRGWSAEVSDNLRRQAGQHGVAPDRLRFAENCGYDMHLSRYAVADLALDTFAHGGHTTASDALWMGCPLVSCTGRSFSARVGTSLLRAAGLPDLVTSTPDQYEALVIRLVQDPQGLRQLRARLDATRDSCALFNAPATVRQLEWAYERMWQIHTAGGPPQAFDVPDELP